MSGADFVQKWEPAVNYLGLRSVGINIVWNKIDLNSKVEQYKSEEAWDKIYEFTTPWFKTPKTFKYIFDTNDTDYRAIVLEEISNGKLQKICASGVNDPIFPAFADSKGRITILGDGNHRFLNLNFLMSLGKKFPEVISNTELDIIILDNFNEVLEPHKIWGESYNLT